MGISVALRLVEKEDGSDGRGIKRNSNALVYAGKGCCPFEQK
jgi:hypothetical protein